MGDAYADIPRHGEDLARAVSVCINSKRCEIPSKGVMCPSYRVTDNPALSPGGRIKLLKQALNSEQPIIALTDPRLRYSMSLCTGCKGCKRECENSVDMSMLKIEYMSQMNAIFTPDIRTRLFANAPQLISRIKGISQFIQWRNAFNALALVTEKILGISAQRNLPIPSKKTFFQEYSNDGNTRHESVKKEVVLFIDSFTNLFSPEIAKSALKVLNKAGYQVHIARPSESDNDIHRPLCCGRSKLANGMIESATLEARRTLEALYPHAKSGRLIIGLEPSCLLAIRDDYRYLKLGEMADTVASQAFLFEEFIAQEIKGKRFNLAFEKPASNTNKLLIHGHCHQKAVGAMKSVRRIMKLIPGIDFEMIESSCCGMAGNFGIEKENFKLSMKMAEDSLLPKIRNHPEADVMANGFSCRQQIRDGSNREAFHIATILDNALRLVEENTLN